MLTAPRDTLAYQLKGRPLSLHRDMSLTPLPTVMATVNAWMSADKEPNTKPETDALWFYMMNHAVSEVRKKALPLQPLGPLLPILDTYHSSCAPRAFRMFAYLLLIVTREARHLQSKTAMAGKLQSAGFHPDIVAFLTSLPGGESEAVKQLRTNPPAVSIGKYVEAVQMIYYKGSWASAYGGPKWGVITDCLHAYVTGKYSAEMMLDTAYTLAHNTAPIFNKGMCFSMNGAHLIRLLDVQRSGQIPQAVASDALLQSYVTPGLSGARAMCEKLIGPSFGGYVDWFKVEALGSVHKYKNDQKAQVAAHGPPQHLEAELAAKAAAEADKIAAETKGWFTVSHSTKVKKVVLARA